MNDVRRRLAKCFESVFPDMPAGDIPLASQKSVAKWDSIAAITLVNVIEEEFGFPIDFDLLPELDSFDRILSYVELKFQPAEKRWP